MTDAQLFLCVVLFFYVSGRCLWRPARSFAFRSILFSPYRAVVEPSTLSNRSGSLLVCDPFVPLRPVYLVDLPPLIFAPNGLAIVKTEDPMRVGAERSWMRFEEITAVTRSERAVTINDQVVRTRTITAAASLVAQVETLRGISSNERADRIRTEMKRAFNVREARRILRKTSGAVDRLRFNANTWLAGIFFAYLIAAARFGYVTMTLFLLLALEAAAVHLSVQFFRIHRRFFPDEGRFRTGELVKFLCCSPTSFHCVDAITSGLLAQFHPVLVAHLICDPAEFDRHCARWVRALKYGKISADDQELWVRAEQERLMGAFLQSVGHTAEAYLAAPSRIDPESKSYCPRCETQYDFANGLCPDCDILVLPFPANEE